MLTHIPQPSPPGPGARPAKECRERGLTHECALIHTYIITDRQTDRYTHSHIHTYRHTDR